MIRGLSRLIKVITYRRLFMNSTDQREKWNQRYGTTEYAYGKQPNDYLKSVSYKIPSGKVLCLAEGEGRNAVYLAEQGYQVTALDYSSRAIEKAEQLARQREVAIHAICADLEQFDFTQTQWQAIISVFAHLPPYIRKKVHSAVSKSLAPRGIFILEAYAPDQLKFNSGGPPNPELLMNLNEIKDELTGLEFEISHQIERNVTEGTYHSGQGAVIQILAIKPYSE